VVIIPARWASTRFPGKVLSDVFGLPLIHRIVAVCRASRHVADIYVATDDARVSAAATEAGATAVMTSRRLRSGSDRVAVVARTLNAGIVVNVQGDEMFDDPRLLGRLISVLQKHPEIQVATPARTVSAKDAADPHLVKVVVDRTGSALYFSRSRVPYYRDGKPRENYLGHIGIYACRRRALLEFARAAKTPLETAENLEQLRFLERGIGIHVLKTSCITVGVDTPEDLRTLKILVRNKRLRLRGDRDKL